jgi:hypothetical protein
MSAIYYEHDGIIYIGTFPAEWIETHANDKTGPKECGNCAYFGRYRGVFIGYCLNCSDYVYNGERGHGFNIYTDDAANVKESSLIKTEYPGAMDTYLKGVNIEKMVDEILNKIIDEYSSREN